MDVSSMQVDLRGVCLSSPDAIIVGTAGVSDSRPLRCALAVLDGGVSVGKGQRRVRSASLLRHGH